MQEQRLAIGVVIPTDDNVHASVEHHDSLSLSLKSRRISLDLRGLLEVYSKLIRLNRTIRVLGIF